MYETVEEIETFFKQLFHYRFVQVLGAGAFGRAVLAHDTVEREDKVFKLPKDEETTESLKNEGEHLKSLRKLLDGNIIQLHQFGYVVMDWNGKSEERYYLNMAYGGKSLRSLIGDLRVSKEKEKKGMVFGSGQRLPIERAVRIAMDVASGLRSAHSFQGVDECMLHRDIKPENILIDDRTGIARIVDFGIARVLKRTSLARTLAGTPIYMAPEALDRKQPITSVRTDLFSLGIVLFELLTGDLPFHTEHERDNTCERLISSVVSEAPPLLDVIVARLIDPDPAARYSDAAELLHELRRVEAQLNPLEPRYTRIDKQADGRWLCRDAESGLHVSVRILRTTASAAEFTATKKADSAIQSIVDRPLRAFRREEFVGVVSRLTAGQTLREMFGDRPLKSIQLLNRLCTAFADICDVLENLHAHGQCHGFLSEHAIVFQENRPVLLELGLAPLLTAMARDGCDGNSLDGLFESQRFMCPDALEGKASPDTEWDIRALAGILYEILTGQNVTTTDNKQSRFAREPAHDPRRFNLYLPASLVTLLAQMREGRLSATQVAQMLRSIHWPGDVIVTWVDEALSLYPQGAPPAAMLSASEILDRAQSLDPGNPVVHWARGILYLRYRAYEYALGELQKSARVFPNAEVFKSLGDSYRAWEGKFRDAAIWYRRALEFGEHPALLRDLAECLAQIGSHESAQRYAARAEELVASGMASDAPLATVVRQWCAGTESFESKGDSPV